MTTIERRAVQEEQKHSEFHLEVSLVTVTVLPMRSQLGVVNVSILVFPEFTFRLREVFGNDYLKARVV